MRWLIAGIGLYFLGHLLYAHGLLWAALVWLALSVTIGLLFGACVQVGREE